MTTPPGTNSFTAGSLTVGKTPIANGTTGLFLYDNNGVVGEQAGGGGGSLTVGTTTISGGTAGFALIDNGGTLEEAPIRTVLTGNLSLYVNASTGSDSYNGLSATYTGGVNGPKATLQAIANLIGSTLDIGGFNVAANIAAGSYVGFGMPSTVGGGIVQFVGAGSASTTITNGPNDGILNTAECVSMLVPMTSYFGIDAVNFDGTDTTDQAAFTIQVEGINAALGNLITGATADVTFSGSPTEYIEITAQSQLFTIPGNYGIIGSGVSLGSGFLIQLGGVFVDLGTWTLSGAANTFALGFLVLAQGVYAAEGSSFTGSANGPRFALTNSSAAYGMSTLTFFPGSSAGTADASCSYATELFAGQISGAPTTSNLLAGAWGVFKDTTQPTGSGVVLAYNDAGTVVDIGSTVPGGTTGDVQYNNGSGGFAGGAPIAVSSTDTPATLFGADLKAWYKADVGVTLSGSAVTGWADQSGGGNNLSVPGGQTSPSFSPYGMGGNPAITFKAFTDSLASSAVTLFSSTTASFYAVVRFNYQNLYLARMLIYATAGSDAGDATGCLVFLQSNTTLSELQTYQNGSSVITTRGLGGMAARLGAVFDGTHLTSYVNNIQQGQASLSFSWGANKTLAVGVNSTSNSALFDIAELVVLDRAPSGTEFAKLDTYFLSKWGIRPFYG